MSKMFTIGVRYCGGCNPTYDRGAVAKALAARFPGIGIEPAQPETVYDLAVVLRGCWRPCVGWEGLPARYGSTVVSDETEAQQLYRQVGELLAKQKGEHIDGLEAGVSVEGGERRRSGRAD